MKNVIMLIVAVVALLIIWGMVKAVISTALHLAFTIGIILLLGWIVVSVYKSMTKQKSIL